MTTDQISLEPATSSDVDFLYSCLLTLRGGAKYSREDLSKFCERTGLYRSNSPVLIASKSTTKFGMLTCNRFVIPRYLGFGIELEEVVIAPKFQGQGLAEQMLLAFLAWAHRQPEIRRVQVRTDDELRAGRIYSRIFRVTESKVYSSSLNPL